MLHADVTGQAADDGNDDIGNERCTGNTKNAHAFDAAGTEAEYRNDNCHADPDICKSKTAQRTPL